MRSGPGEARTILLLHIISVRPSKQPLMVRTFLKIYMELGSSFLFLQGQIKDIIIIRMVCYRIPRTSMRLCVLLRSVKLTAIGNNQNSSFLPFD